MTRLGELTYRRAGPIVLGALLLLAAATPLALQVFDRVEPFDISDPGSEVELAYAAFEGAVGAGSEADVVLLVEPASGDPLPASRRAARQLGRVAGVAAVSGPSRRAAQVSADGRAALVLGFLASGAGRVETGERVQDRFAGDPAVRPGGVAVAAAQIGEQTETDTRRIELFAAPLLLLLLLAVFRSPVAAVLPLILAGFSIVITLALLSAIAPVIAIDLFSLQVVTGLGVGLAIDYSLFVLARYRIEMRRGEGLHQAQLRTMAAAGRTVAFGAATVAAALAALILFPQQFLSSTGIAGGLVALLSGAAAVLVLPALLALLGSRVDPGFAAAASPQDAAPDPLSGGSRFWSNLAARVWARPAPIATLALALMLAIAAPALGGGLTTPDARVLPESESARAVFDAIDDRFPELPSNRISVIVPAGASAGRLRRARRQLIESPSITELTPVRRLPDGRYHLTVSAGDDPLSEAGQDTLDAVRGTPWPAGTLTGGRAAELADQRSSIGENAPPVVALVVLTNLVLVLLMARSLVLPLLSLGLNALTVLASYGVMVALFETEATAELLGTFAQDGIDVSVPVLAFAVVFGLSTDYGIFLFARIAEARRDGLPERDAVAAGLARTGRLITSAAVLFAVAIGVNVFSDLVIVKEFAVAVAVAVILDATVVRGLLVPAALRLLGSRAWWWPGRRRTSAG